MEYCNIKREEIDETLGEFDYYGSDLEIIKNEKLVHQMCTDEIDIKDELEEKNDETIKGTLNYTENEYGDSDYRLMYNYEKNNAEGMAEADVAILKEKNSSVQTTSISSNDDSMKYSFGRQSLDSFEETPTNETDFKGFLSISSHVDKNLYYRCEICNYNNLRKCYLSNLFKECEFGNYQTVKKLALPTDMLIHSPKLFKCTVCDYKCTYKSHLLQHVRMHTGEKPFQCSVCYSKFTQKYNLVRHNMLMHTDVKPFQCSTCDYKCAQKSHLASHMRMHTGVKPFQCSVCEYKFSQKVNLVGHMLIHTGEKRFLCSACDYKCAQKNHLVSHMRIHTGYKPFQCRVCDNKFAQKSHLAIHMRIHTGEKPFECVCGNKFTHKCNLVTHMRKHTGA